MQKLAVFFLSVISLFLISCSGQPSSIIPSTSPLPQNVRGDIPTKGSDCQYAFLGIIPVSGPPNTQDALTEAKSNVNVDVLTDVTVDHTGRYWILFSNRCIHVRGMGVSRDVTNELLPNLRERNLGATSIEEGSL